MQHFLPIMLHLVFERADLYTAKELAVLPIKATYLFSKGNRLLAFGHDDAKSFVTTVYSLDTQALRSGQWQVDQVLAQCQQAATLLAESGDLYGAINLCQAAGVEGLVDEVKSSSRTLAVIKQYALWLSKTLDRGSAAIPLLHRVQKVAPSPEVGKALAEVRLKTRVLEGSELGTITAEEKKTDFALTLDTGSSLSRRVARDIDFGAFSDRFHFSGDKVYVGRFGCHRCPDGGASLGVLDRNTFEELGSIQIVPNDDDYQDNVAAITSDKSRVFVSVDYRYESTRRPNFFIVDKATFKIKKKAKVKAPPFLIFEHGQLMACGCSFTDEQACTVLDPVTIKTVDAPGKVCVTSGARNDYSVVDLQSDGIGSKHFVALTKDYLVASAVQSKEASYVLYPRVADSLPMPIQLDPEKSLDWPLSISDNLVLVSQGVRQGQLIKLVTLPTGETQILFGLPTGRSRVPVPLLYKKTLFVGLGRDLIVFDISTNRLLRYIQNFIPVAFKNNGNGLDMNRIDRLMIDRERLIALTFYGENSQIVPLSSFTLADR